MTDKTNIEYFNSYLKLFVNNIIETYSEFDEILRDYYKDLLENDSCNDDKYVKRYMKKMKEYKQLISNKSDDLFKDSIFILKNVDFKIIWSSEELSDNNKDTIWEYIQTLYIIGETIISDSNKVQTLLDNFRKGETDNSSENVDNELLEMFKNLSENKNNSLDENFLSECSLGKLATELTDEINLNDMNLNIDENSNVNDMFNNLISGDNTVKFMNLIQKVGQKIQTKVESGDFNQSKLMDEAKYMMDNMGGGNMQNLFSSIANSNLDNFINEPSNPTRDRLRQKLQNRKK